MKVTVKEKQDVNKNVPFDEIPVGYVYVALYKGGPTALKLSEEQAVLLCCTTDPDWFMLANGYKGNQAYKVLGKLTEIIVEEQ